MAQVLKIMKQCGVIERYFLAIGKFEPGIYIIVRSFSPDRGDWSTALNSERRR